MTKRILIASLLFLVMERRGIPEPQIPVPAAAPSGVITLTTGTAIRFVPSPNTSSPVKCNSMLVQPLPGSVSGNPIYVLNAPVNITMTKDANGTTTVAALAAATSTSPGPGFTYPSNGEATTQSGGFDLRYWGVVGSTGDTVLATCDLRN